MFMRDSAGTSYEANSILDSGRSSLCRCRSVWEGCSIIMVSEGDKCFHRVMKRETVTEVVLGPFAFGLEFPPRFCNDHGHLFHEKATLERPDCDTKWPLAITVQDSGGVFAHGDGGWSKFVQENNVKVGNLLIFQLVAFSRFVVHIFPSEDDPDAALPCSDRFVAMVVPSTTFLEKSSGTKTRVIHHPIRQDLNLEACRSSEGEQKSVLQFQPVRLDEIFPTRLQSNFDLVLPILHLHGDFVRTCQANVVATQHVPISFPSLALYSKFDSNR